ncbi:hypothetical protein Tco_0180700 [Tanacetum coccineum]
MGRDTVQLETAVSTISQEYLLEFTSEYGISEGLHPELPGRGDMVVDFPERKVGMYTKFFEFANFRIPISQFLFYILGHYQIHLSQLSVDEKVFPTVVEWRISAPKDGMPVEGTYSVEDVALLNTRRTPIQRQPELLLCLVGLSRRYFLGDDVYPTFLYDDGREMDLFNLISAPNPAAVKTETRPQVAHEVPLLNTTASRVIDMEDVVATSTSSGTPSAMEKSPLDFANEDPPLTITNRGETENPVPVEASQEDLPAENPTTTEVVPEVNLEKDVTVMGALVNKRRRKRDTSEMETNATPKVLRTDHASVRHESMIRGGKSLAAMGVGADIPSPMPAQQSMSDPDPLSYARPQPTHEPEIAQSSKGATIAGDPDSEKSSSFTSFAGSPGGIYQLGRGITNSCHLDTPGACQVAVDHMVPPGYFSELGHLPNEEFLNQYNVNLARQVAMGSKLRLRFEQEVRLLKKAKEKVAKRDQRIHAREEKIKKLDQEVRSLKVVDTEVQGLRNQTRNLETPLEAEVDMKNAAEANSAELTKELESLRAKFSDLQVNNNQLSQQVATLQAQVTGKEQIKTTFEEFKKREDDKVERRCAEMDARLDEMSIDFNEELYPHMLTAMAGRRWVIRRSLGLAIMKCVKSTKLRQAFANVVSAGIAKGMSEGLKHGVEHGKA